MSHWNHRIIRHAYPDGSPSDSMEWYGVHEVYYDDAGEVDGWTADAIAPFGESLDELKHELLLHLDAFTKPVIDEPAEMDRLANKKVTT